MLYDSLETIQKAKGSTGLVNVIELLNALSFGERDEGRVFLF